MWYNFRLRPSYARVNFPHISRLLTDVGTLTRLHPHYRKDFFFVSQKIPKLTEQGLLS